MKVCVYTYNVHAYILWRREKSQSNLLAPRFPSMTHPCFCC